MEYLSEFITTKKVQGCRERTIEDYQLHVSYFFRNYQGEIGDYHYRIESSKILMNSYRCLN